MITLSQAKQFIEDNKKTNLYDPSIFEGLTKYEQIVVIEYILEQTNIETDQEIENRIHSHMGRR